MAGNLTRTQLAIFSGVLPTFIALAVLTAGSVFATTATSRAETAHLYPVYTEKTDARSRETAAATFRERIRAEGSMPVIVGLRLKLRAERELSRVDADVQAAVLEAMQGRIARHVLEQTATNIKSYSSIPFMAMRVNEEQFQKNC